MKEFLLFCVAFAAMVWYRRVIRKRVARTIVAPVMNKAKEPPLLLTIWETSASCDVEIRDGRTGHRILWSVSAFGDQGEAEDALAYVVRQIKTKNVTVRFGK